MSVDTFEIFADECCQQISAMQNSFLESYDMDSYENWFFDKDFGVFHFQSNDGRNLYFNYTLAGSFSTKTNTWKWSWANEYLKDSERRDIEKVRAFGLDKGYTQLFTGLIDGDEYTGWAMTSVAAKVLNAIGVYRFPEDHLFFYFVFTGVVSEEEYTKRKEKYNVTCGAHGARRAAFVCQHLNSYTRTGFHEPFDSDPSIEADDDYQAWCDACEKVRLHEGEWNDVSEGFAKIRLVCDQCFFEIKAKNVDEDSNDNNR
jgi:hypothetical protein